MGVGFPFVVEASSFCFIASIPAMANRVCQKKFFFEFPKSGFLICGNYRENNIAIDFRLLLPLVA